jgi:hypothetical protein
MMVEQQIDASAKADAAPSPPRAASSRRWWVALAALAAVAGVVGGCLVVRSHQSATARSSTASAMPVSPAIEAKFGIRLSLVAVTAGGGMIQIQYQILDSAKASAVHDATIAPFVVDANGVKYADPGMVGHTHVGNDKAAGTTDYILLANARGGVRSGSKVTIKVGDLELRSVRVL